MRLVVILVVAVAVGAGCWAWVRRDCAARADRPRVEADTWSNYTGPWGHP